MTYVKTFITFVPYLNKMNQLEKKTLLQKKLELQDVVKEYQRAIDAIDIVLKLMESTEPAKSPIGDIPNNLLSQISSIGSYPDFPKEADLIEKIRYYESKTNRVIALNDFSEFIQKVESKKEAAKTVNYLNQKVNKLVQAGTMWSLKYNGSNKYAFYTSHIDWIDIISKNKARILPGHEPVPEKLIRLSNEQKQYENIVWSKLN